MRYYLLNRPDAYPPGAAASESWLGQRETETGRLAYGWAEYDEPLGWEEIEAWDLWPADAVERAEYLFARDPDGAWLRSDYLETDRDALERLREGGDPLAWAALVLLDAQAKEREA